MHPPRFLFLLKQKQGYTTWGSDVKKPGLWNSVSTTVDALNKFGMSSHIELVVDQNGIDAALHKYKPEVAFIEAYWVSPAKLQLLKILHPKVTFIIRNHSEVPFLAEDGMGLAWTTEYLKLGIEVSNVSTRTVDDLRALTTNLRANPDLVSFLPNIYLGRNHPVVPTKALPGWDLHVACFGAVRPMKNHMEQALAAIRFAAETARRLYFHINGTRVEGNGTQCLKNLRNTFLRMENCELVEHGWLDKPEYYDLLRTKIDVMFQCSLTESFNIVAADSVLCSVPVIASPEIRWLSPVSHVNPLQTDGMVEKLYEIFGDLHKDLDHYANTQRSDLTQYNERAAMAWIHRFGRS